MSLRCGLCSSVVGPDGLGICGPCHQRGAGPAPNVVRATGEFMVPSLPADLVDASGGEPGASGTCSWCGKDGGAVRKLLGNGTVAICNECVALCADVMDAELGAGWRS